MEGQQRAGRGDANGWPLFEHSRSFRRPKKPSLSQMIYFKRERHLQGEAVLLRCTHRVAWYLEPVPSRPGEGGSGHADRRKRVPTSHSVCQSCQRDDIYLPRQSFKEDKVYIMYERKCPDACEEMLDDTPVAHRPATTTHAKQN